MNRDLLLGIRKMTEKELYAAIYTDALTGAGNRLAFDQAEYRSVAIIDLDSLKWVNDTHGHRCGDTFLCSLVRSLETYFGPENVYRISGGDEFAVTSQLHYYQLEAVMQSVQTEVQWFSFGAGATLGPADTMLLLNKKERELCGQRAKRGECPPWEIENARAYMG